MAIFNRQEEEEEKIQYGNNKLKRLVDVYENSIVRITTSKGSNGTGFFIAKGIILTCAHVVKSSNKDIPDDEIKVHLDNVVTYAKCVKFISEPYPDLAILQTNVDNKYSVVFNDHIDFGDDVVCIGFADGGKIKESTTFTFEGNSYHPFQLIKLKGGQAVSGMSGSPILNLKTGGICGVLKRSRDTESDLGGRGIPLGVITQFVSKYFLQNLNFHRISSSWTRFLNPIQTSGYNDSKNRIIQLLKNVWVPIYIQGEFISAICHHPVKNNIIFAGSNFTAKAGVAGLYKSLDSGRSWTVCNFSLEWGIVKKIVVSENEIFVVTDRGVFISNDTGENWELFHERYYNNSNIACLEISPFDSEQVLVGTIKPRGGFSVSTFIVATASDGSITNKKSKNVKDGGLHISLDKGENWDTYIDIKELKSSAFSSTDPSIIYLLEFEQGIIKTEDGGNNWKKLPVIEGVGKYYDIAICKRDHDVVFVSTNLGYFISYDSGNEWIGVNAECNNISEATIIYIDEIDAFVGHSASDIFLKHIQGETSILLNNFDVEIRCLSYSEGEIYFGTNGGGIKKINLKTEALTDISKGLAIPVGSSITFRSLDTTEIYVGTALGLINFNNKLAPQVIDDYRFRNVWSLQMISMGEEGSNVRASNMFFSKNGGETWCHNINTSPQVLMVGDSGSIWFKNLKPNDWKHISLDGAKNIWAIRKKSNNLLFAATQGGGLYISQNAGETWEKSNNGFEKELNLTDIAFINDVYLAGTSNNGLFKSYDNGKSWGKVETFQSSKAIFPIMTTKSNGIVCGTEGDGIFESVDNGETWNSISENLPEKNIRSILISPDSSFIYVGTTKGIFLTSDNGKTWEGLNEGLLDFNLSINDLNFINNHTLIAATKEGIFCCNLDSKIADEIEKK